MNLSFEADDTPYNYSVIPLAVLNVSALMTYTKGDHSVHSIYITTKIIKSLLFAEHRKQLRYVLLGNEGTEIQEI